MIGHTSETGFFPVTQSLLAASALASEVLHAYDIGQVTDCKLLHHNLNDLYVVTSADAAYVLRVGQSRGRHEQDVRYEVDLLNHLDRTGVPVAAPVALRDGGFARRLQAPEGPRLAVLFASAPGAPLTAPDQDEQTAHAYGRAAALMHDAANDLVSPHARFRLDLGFLVDAPLTTILPLLGHRQQDRDALVEIACAVKERIARIPGDGLEVGPCHGDLTGANASVGDDGTLTFFDFEYCGLGFRAYDLATFRWGAAMGRHRMGMDDEGIWSSFCAGYAAHRAIRRADMAAIPPFVAARHLWYMGLQTANWDYWGCGEVDDAFFDRELGFLRDWVTDHVGYQR